ncbi:MAG TPA: hypothetical protein VM573_01260 [Actinomycetota bacterium]|jgi:hypothetical protein|nr:hypothetical protein [Actinomycetota bacterium]
MAEHPEGLRNRVFCSSCGVFAQRRQGLVPIGWQEMPDKDNRRLALCPECVRRNLWLIEARFDLDPGSGF